MRNSVHGWELHCLYHSTAPHRARESTMAILSLIGCYLVDDVLVPAKAQEIGKISYFVDTVDDVPNVSIAVRKRHQLTTAKGSSEPVSIGIPTRKGTLYAYRQNGYYIEVQMKKMVAHLTFQKEMKR
jgi:hypothetical protein